MNPMTTNVRPLARLATALLLAVAAGSTAETLTLGAAQTVISVNQQVVVTVGLTGAGAFSVWGQSLTWDKTKLELVSQNALTSAFGVVVNDSRATGDINTTGEVRTGGYFVASGPSYPDQSVGAANLAVLTFKRIAAGSTTLTAQAKDGSNPFGGVVVTAAGTERVVGADATVTFTDAPPANTAPTITDISNRSIQVGANTGALSFTINDTEMAAASLAVSATSSNTGVATVALSGSGATRSVTVTGVSAGTSTITVTVSDGALSASDTFVVTVTAAPPVNTAPTITDISNRSIQVGANTGALSFAINDAEMAAASLAASATSSNTSVATVAVSGSGATRSVTVTGVSAGTSTITVTVSDGALSASDTFVVTVTAANNAPTVSAGPDRVVVQTAAATLDGTATDTDGPSALTVQWTVTGTPPGTVTFANAAAIDTTATFSVTGTYTLRLTGNDGARTAFDEMTVQVNAPDVNGAPLVNAGADQVLLLPVLSTTLTGTVTDDGLPLGATVTRNWALVSGLTGTVIASASNASTAVTFPEVGAYQLVLSASDTVLTGSDTVTVLVVDPSQPNGVLTLLWPNGSEILTPGNTVTVLWRGGSRAPATITISISTDGGATWVIWASGLPNNGGAMLVVPALANGTILVNIRDSAGHEDVSDRAITVGPGGSNTGSDGTLIPAPKTGNGGDSKSCGIGGGLAGLLVISLAVAGRLRRRR